MINIDQLVSILSAVLTLLLMGHCVYRSVTGRSTIGSVLIAAAALAQLFVVPWFFRSVGDEIFPPRTTTAPVTFDNLAGWWWLGLAPVLLVVVQVLVIHWPDRSRHAPEQPEVLHRARWYLAGDGPVAWLTHPRFFRDAEANRWAEKVTTEMAGGAETDRLCEQIVAAWRRAQRNDIDPALVDGDPSRVAMLQQALELLQPPVTGTQRAVAARLILTAGPEGLPTAATNRLARWVSAAPDATWPTLAEYIPGTVTEGSPPEAGQYETYPAHGADRDRW